jgi:hypothetical protein
MNGRIREMDVFPHILGLNLANSFLLYLFSILFYSLFLRYKNIMPAHENNKVISLEHPSGSKAEIALFGKLVSTRYHHFD